MSVSLEAMSWSVTCRGQAEGAEVTTLHCNYERAATREETIIARI